ncbi:MAG TPA: acetyl-CoA carboxylase carboxyltransferase subunit beta [bacterium (Candidatus Stahlbacteria)]|nr:acetyl-CoA carboxylase carboxyltransferase subunit beta [Candidatus Stahlbacteria bacterium]
MWFRKPKKIKPLPKKGVPDGLWLKCDDCGEILYRKELEKNLWICEKCGYHFRISARKYVEILADEFIEKDSELEPSNPLEFKEYVNKLAEDRNKTGLKEAIITGEAKINNHRVALGVMDFSFRGGSMGSVVGEKVKRLIYFAKNERIPLIIVSASGGARMQEGILSLMQMAKTASALAEFSLTSIPYISVLTNPTTAGVMASYASLGDIIIAEPKALLGFAGPRVIQQTINQELPPGFQTSEFLLEHGMLDAIVPRNKLKETLVKMLDFFAQDQTRNNLADNNSETNRR